MKKSQTTKNDPARPAHTFQAIKPSERPVAGVALVAELEATFNAYLVLPPGGAAVLAFWVLFAHTFAAWTHSPRLAFTSREPECGKTTALSILAQLVPNALPTVNMTTAVMFRIIGLAQPTLLIDEADTFMEGNEEMRGILNSGHTKDTAFVWRCHPETLVPERFSTWGPLAIGKIGGLPPSLATRSIPMAMRKKLLNEPLVRLTPEARPGLAELAGRCARWSADHLEELKLADPTMPPRVGSRLADNWRPLLALADEVGGQYPRSMRLLITSYSGIVAASVSRSPAEAIVEYVQARYNLTSKGVPEFQVIQQLAKLTVAKAVQPLYRELLKRGDLRLVEAAGKRSVVPGGGAE